MSGKKKVLSLVGNFFKDLFTKNLPLKGIALLFAFLLWGYVLTIENPEYTKTVRDVEIVSYGEESLTEKGLMLVSRELGTTDVDVLCKISKHSELDASRISCSVDLSSRAISLADEEDSKVIPLTVQTTLQSGYGTITAVEVSTVNVEVARISTRTNLPVSIEYTGSLPMGFQVKAPDRLSITVKGTKSLVDAISHGVITVDLDAFPVNDPETLAGEYSGVYQVRFYNSSNVALENILADNGESYTIEVPLTIRAYRELPILPNIQIDDGYDYTFTLSRDTVTLYGDRAVLQSLDSVSTQPITALPNMNSEAIEIDLVLPDGVSMLSSDTGKVTVLLTVTEQTDTREFTVPLAVTGLSDKLIRGERFPTEVTIRVTGTLRELDALSLNYIKASINLTGCGLGSHTVPVLIEIDSRAGAIQAVADPTEVTVALTEPEPEPTTAPAKSEGE